VGGRITDFIVRRSTRRALATVVVPLVLVASASGARTQAAPASVRQFVLANLASRGSLTGRHVSAPASTAAAAACGTATGVQCSQVVVPLDRTGRVPGTISLHVEYLPADGPQRGVVFLIAGGPGQGSAHTFGLDSPSSAAVYRFLFPGYGIVAYDDRGTGDSGLLDCPGLQVANTADSQRAAAAACANTIGPPRDFYSTAQHAEDLDAVRQSLGVDKIALWGVSYGTKLAMAYALAHPDHVERLLLDSVLPPEGPDPYGADVLSRITQTLGTFCSDGGCRSATSDFGGDVAAVANKLAAKPLLGKVTLPSGRTVTKKVDGLELLTVVLDADLSPGLAAELPAVVHAARAGNTQPLLRLATLHDTGSVEQSADLSFALYAATVCRDGPFPWQPDTPISARSALLSAAVAALPAGSLGPFGPWAARFGNADFCLDWPSPAGGAALGMGPLPDVPMLAVSGSIDMRTPTANAVSVAARFPQGHVLVVQGVGHSTVTSDPSGCAARAVHSWMLGGAVPDQCARTKPLVAPVPALPAPGPLKPSHPAGALQTYAIASKTVREAEALWLMTAGLSGSTKPVPGIYGGKLVATSARTFNLVRYSIARGVTLTGKLRVTGLGPPIGFDGAVTVGGADATSGVLGLSGSSLRGTLGGRLVG
jgi:pimeloyl-ACP methyl ester carboxylesterase